MELLFYPREMESGGALTLPNSTLGKMKGIMKERERMPHGSRRPSQMQLRFRRYHARMWRPITVAMGQMMMTE